MLYYLIEWENEEYGDPWRVYLEMDERGNILRKVESFRIGLFQGFDNLNESADPHQLAGKDGTVIDLMKSRFDEVWGISQEMTEAGGFMTMMSAF